MEAVVKESKERTSIQTNTGGGDEELENLKAKVKEMKKIVQKISRYCRK